jgi:hypothetical protein
MVTPAIVWHRLGEVQRQEAIVRLTHAIRYLIVLASCALALSGCASLKVDSFLERGADLNQYRSYAWGPADRWSTGDPRLDNNTVFGNRVRSQVEKHLTTKGLELTASTLPDLFLHYHISVSQRIDVRTLDNASPPTEDSGPSVFVYDAGTLVIEVLDARSARVLWRGWAEGSFEGLIDDQALLEARVDQAVQQILQRLPRV